MMRTFLLILTNVSVISFLPLILFLLGIHSYYIFYIIVSASIIGFGGAFISLLLAKKISLFSVGAKIITKPENETENWLLNTIKKQSSMLGLHTPELAIYHSLSVNAFATGMTKKSSVIAISSGLINSMNKNEIEAVIAHEMSHIENGDMITMTLIQGIMNTFVIFLSRGLAYIICSALSSENKSSSTINKNRTGEFILKFFLEIIFGILASCITMWFSRRREFYADAGAAKLLGTKKMISALKVLQSKIYLINEPKNINALCINGNENSFLKLFLSHPSIDLRIEALHKKKYM